MTFVVPEAMSRFPKTTTDTAAKGTSDKQLICSRPMAESQLVTKCAFVCGPSAPRFEKRALSSGSHGTARKPK